MILETERLTLKPLSPEDAEPALDLLTNPIIAKTYMLPDFAQRQDALPLFNRLMGLSQGNDRYIRGIYLGGYLIGYLNEVEVVDGAMEVGYLIHPDYHGHGYMPEALKAVIQDLFRLGFEEVIAGAFEGNHASERVMIKVGMQKIQRSDTVDYRGKTWPCFYYSMKKQV